ncbi:MAG: hypothetical protein KF724_07940 [Phycisphaeraceae bacterium]|nr:hypothetical protein [Phycisphaeraceae bacterium]
MTLRANRSLHGVSGRRARSRWESERPWLGGFLVLILAAAAAPVAPAVSAMAPQPQAARSAPTARELDERLTLWLEREAQDRLLQALLEDRLARETADLDRRDLAERLRGVLLERLRRDLVGVDVASSVAERLRPLLPAVDADELHVELLRARLRRGERRADEVRLGAAPEGDAAKLLPELAALAADADRMRRRLEIDLRDDARRLDRSVGIEAEELLDAVDRKREIVETARFVQAWALLHGALLARSTWVTERGDAWRPRTLQALEQFIALLDTGFEDPRPEDVSMDRLGEDLYASALLGATLSRHQLEGPEAAAPWWALLEDSRAAPTLRRSAPGWRLYALALGRPFDLASKWLNALALKGVVPPSWIRLAVLECRSPEVLARPEAVGFVQSALAVLGAQEALAEALALADLLPAFALPEGGFVGGYLRGIRAYTAALALPPETPIEARRAEFLRAATILRGAASESDAAATPLGVASARHLAAWSMVGADSLADASVLFEQASESLPPVRAAESLWLAAESAERAAQRASGADRRALEEARERIFDRLLERFPESAQALRAEVTRIRGERSTDTAALDRLRSIPRGSPAWIDALVASEEILYQRVRRGREDERRDAARSYLEVARAEDAPTMTMRRIWLRRRAEVALLTGLEQPVEAHAALSELRARGASGDFELDDIEGELRLREMQLAAFEGRFEDAMGLLRGLESQAASADGGREVAQLSVRLGRRAILRSAQRNARPEQRGLVIDMGAAILADEGEALDDTAAHAIALAVGEAAAALPADGERPRVDIALKVLAEARERRSVDAQLLELTSRVAERAGDDATLLECVRMILAGTTLGDRAWFDARVRQVRALARTDPVQARRVLNQHRALIPDWGPEPWGPELRAINARVPAIGPDESGSVRSAADHSRAEPTP